MRSLESTVVFFLAGGAALAACGNGQDTAGGSDAGVDAAPSSGDGGSRATCEQGACATTEGGACGTGFADCDLAVAGCETKLGTTANCTACGDSCGGDTPVCGSKGCVSSCPPAFPSTCNGSCTDTQDDPKNCGACGTVCTGDGGLTQGLCVAGVCESECKPAYNACGGTCVSEDDETACGPSCTVCPGAPLATPSCADDRCGLACVTGAHSCSGACVANDSTASCGSSCQACPVIANATATCDGTTCGQACNAGFATCRTGEGATCATSLMNDASNCGTCGHSCLYGTCRAGVCQAFEVLSENGPSNFEATPTGYYEASSVEVEHVVSSGAITGYGGSFSDVIGNDGFAVWSTPTGTITWGGPTFDKPFSVPVPPGQPPTSLALSASGVAWTDPAGNLLNYDPNTKVVQTVAVSAYDSPGTCALSNEVSDGVFFEMANGYVFRWDGYHANAVAGIAQVPPGSAALAADATSLYLGDPNGVVSSVAATGGPLTSLTTVSAAVASLAVDGSGGLYILTSAGLARYDLKSGQVTTLSTVGAGTGSRCHALAVAPTEYVWSGEVQGAYAIWALAR